MLYDGKEHLTLYVWVVLGREKTSSRWWRSLGIELPASSFIALWARLDGPLWRWLKVKNNQVYVFFLWLVTCLTDWYIWYIHWFNEYYCPNVSLDFQLLIYIAFFIVNTVMFQWCYTCTCAGLDCCPEWDVSESPVLMGGRTLFLLRGNNGEVRRSLAVGLWEKKLK